MTGLLLRARPGANGAARGVVASVGVSPLMESDPGKQIKEVWAYLSDAEALELAEALNEYLSEPQAPGWHCHIADSDGNELSVGVGEPDDPSFASRFAKPS